MIKKLIPLILILIGGGAGVAAGLVLKPDAPPAETAEDAEGEAQAKDTKPNKEAVEDAKTARKDAAAPVLDENGAIVFEYAKMSNQFVVPIIRGENVNALVVIALTLEVKGGATDIVFTVEPRLRDTFLQVMFDHAAIGGFDGAFANNHNLMRLRRALNEAAFRNLGNVVNDVLITEIVRQDM